MELVGKLVRYQEDRDRHYLQAVFCCSNKEEFILIQPRAINRLPEDTTVRVFTMRLGNEDGSLSKESIIMHWENLDGTRPPVHPRKS